MSIGIDTKMYPKTVQWGLKELQTDVDGLIRLFVRIELQQEQIC